jgi:hypothetical protein
MRLDPGDHPRDLVEHYEAFLKHGHRAMLRMVDAEVVAQAVELGIAQEERRHVAVRTSAPHCGGSRKSHGPSRSNC